MTPDDVAAIRAEWRPAAHMPVRREQVLALCDALEASWAERDARYTGQELKLERINRKNAEKRAERAEAERDNTKAGALHAIATERERAERAEAEASVTTEALRYLGARADVMAAALARVRDLTHPNHKELAGYGICGCCDEPWPCPWEQIRAALEGGNQ